MSVADNVVGFARLLRACGMPIGTDRIMLTLQALQVAGLESPADFYAALCTCLVSRAEHRVVFDQAFAAFWQQLGLQFQASQSLPPLRRRSRAESQAAARRVSEALFGRDPGQALPEAPIELAAELSWSDREQLRTVDFDDMSTAEWAQALNLVRRLGACLPCLPSRRFGPAARGDRIDMHAVLRNAARHGGEFASLPHRTRRTRPVPIVVIVDISGSMSRYSRVFLHFTYALMSAAQRGDSRIHVFVFGTRLTHITPRLRARDPDVGLANVLRAVADWSGGTRIGACLKELNSFWARRTLSSYATVLLVTDGLERANLDTLERQMERLARSCRRLIWLNPLLRYDAFEARAQGVRTMLRFVDEHMPVHNVESLEQLGPVLASCFRRHFRETPSQRAAVWS